MVHMFTVFGEVLHIWCHLLSQTCDITFLSSISIIGTQHTFWIFFIKFPCPFNCKLVKFKHISNIQQFIYHFIYMFTKNTMQLKNKCQAAFLSADNITDKTTCYYHCAADNCNSQNRSNIWVIVMMIQFAAIFAIYSHFNILFFGLWPTKWKRILWLRYRDLCLQ